MVAVAGAVDSPRILARQRVTIADSMMSGSKQPFHAAAEMPFSKAEAHVRKAIDSSRALAAEAIEAAVKSLRLQGHFVAACGVLRGSGRILPELKSILASHALIHTAEGEMFRDVLVAAASDCGLPVAYTPEKDLDAGLLRRLQALRKQLGPPWTQDQKLATAAGLRALIQS